MISLSVSHPFLSFCQHLSTLVNLYTRERLKGIIKVKAYQLTINYFPQLPSQIMFKTQNVKEQFKILRFASTVHNLHIKSIIQ